MELADIGMIGLAVMGENLAMNMESKGFRVAVYNRTAPGEEGVVERFMTGRATGKNFIGTHSIEELVSSLKPPRKVMMMVQAGAPVDDVISQLTPFLTMGDVIIDGGNSDFHDTERRVKQLEDNGIWYIGTGISGSEVGALTGPSIMPGGSPEAWPMVSDILQPIAARLDDGTPCCQWIGKGGAGHFVKTVHNGIEYGDMQLIAEAYSLLRYGLQLDLDRLADTFDEWNKGELESYLIEITARILRVKDADGTPLIDNILDVAGQKGTGKWAVMTALDESDPLTLITEAVYARLLSALYSERTEASKLYAPEQARTTPLELTPEEIRQALYAAKLISYTQGFSLITRASNKYRWELDCGTIAKIWRKGCIIRSVFLQKITDAYTADKELENLLFDNFFREKITACLPAWRKVVAQAALRGIAVPGMSSGLSYFDGLRTLHSAANLIQAQRDFFGAHLYERVDHPRGTFFHTDWNGVGSENVSTVYNR